MSKKTSCEDGSLDSLALIWTTIGSEEEGQRLAERLVGDRLAACVQVDGPIQSFYVWKGEKQVEKEYRLAIKTTSKNVELVMDCLSKHHPYEEPEILVTPVLEASEGYRKWVIDQTNSE